MFSAEKLQRKTKKYEKLWKKYKKYDISYKTIHELIDRTNCSKIDGEYEAIYYNNNEKVLNNVKLYLEDLGYKTEIKRGYRDDDSITWSWYEIKSDSESEDE